MTPLTGAGNSTVALSVSISTRFSSFSTRSPSCLSQEPICTSVIDSPTAGTFNSTDILSPLTPHGEGCLLVLWERRTFQVGERDQVLPALPLFSTSQSILPSPLAGEGAGVRGRGWG